MKYIKGKENITFFSKEFIAKIDIANKDKNEVCGLMFGSGNIVSEITMVPNEKPSPTYFEFSSMKAGEVIFDAMQRGLKLIGVWHSHPNNMPNPSMTDYDYMEAHPGIWTIYSPRFNKWASWIRVENNIHPVNTVIIN
jgi:proteasome lid subunit RPN8/RPN11